MTNGLDHGDSIYQKRYEASRKILMLKSGQKAMAQIKKALIMTDLVLGLVLLNSIGVSLFMQHRPYDKRSENVQQCADKVSFMTLRLLALSFSLTGISAVNERYCGHLIRKAQKEKKQLIPPAWCQGRLRQ